MHSSCKHKGWQWATRSRYHCIPATHILWTRIAAVTSILHTQHTQGMLHLNVRRVNNTRPSFKGADACVRTTLAQRARVPHTPLVLADWMEGITPLWWHPGQPGHAHSAGAPPAHPPPAPWPAPPQRTSWRHQHPQTLHRTPHPSPGRCLLGWPCGR